MISFRREKFIPFGGPSGGDGGHGGTVSLVGDRGKTTLSDFRGRRHYKGEAGGPGRAKEQHGKKGKDVELPVPVGTIVRAVDEAGETVLGDITREGQRLVVARGGKGGWGNKHFATSVKQTPRMATEGEAGEERKLILELKLLADVGLIGKPNAGKSTLINAVSAAGSKVADYPFTTLEPKLGVVEIGYRPFVVADIPGLIEGAHSGRGLGHQFLRHIERTRILIHLIDGTSEDPAGDLKEINTELELFNPALGQKPQILAVNKIDISSVRERLPEIKNALAQPDYPVYFISAATGEGVSDLINKAAEMLQKILPVTPPPDEGEYRVFRPKPVDERVPHRFYGDRLPASDEE